MLVAIIVLKLVAKIIAVFIVILGVMLIVAYTEDNLDAKLCVVEFLSITSVGSFIHARSAEHVSSDFAES